MINEITAVQNHDEPLQEPVYSGHPKLLQSPVDGPIAADVMREHFTKFTDMDPTWLAECLFTKELLSKARFKKVLTSPGNLNCALLETCDIIKSNGKAFNDLLLVLFDEPVHKPLAMILKSEYERKLKGLLSDSESRMQSSATCHTHHFNQPKTLLSKDNIQIVKKSPERTDVFNLIKCHSAKWDGFARELHVDDNTRESLKHDISLESDGRLERILKIWIESQCSSVTWEKILDVLISMDLKYTAGKVQDYLKYQEVIDKYVKKPDFKPYESHHRL